MSDEEQRKYEPRGKIRAFKSASGVVWVGDDEHLVVYRPPVRAKVYRCPLARNPSDFERRTNTDPPGGHVEMTTAAALKWWDKVRRQKGGVKLLPPRP